MIGIKLEMFINPVGCLMNAVSWTRLPGLWIQKFFESKKFPKEPFGLNKLGDFCWFSTEWASNYNENSLQNQKRSIYSDWKQMKTVYD